MVLRLGGPLKTFRRDGWSNLGGNQVAVMGSIWLLLLESIWSFLFGE
jgi:hypothetical protein